MRLFQLCILSFALTLLSYGNLSFAQEQPYGTAPATEEAKEATETPASAAPAEEAAEATENEKITPPPEEEEIFEEEVLQEVPEAEAPEGEKGKPLPRKLTIDAVIVVKYSFGDGVEPYSIKYHINMGGSLKADVGMIKGNAKVATDISGFLAKSSAFECLLKISIADVPYEIMFKKTSEDEADINVSFKDQILEDWESLCTFLDASGAKFNTRGAPERWIGTALEKANPSLSKLSAPIDPKKTTTQKFTISQYTIQDEGLGSAEISGTGVVTIEPERKQGPEKKEEAF
ncbi:MAG: hypothetical protein HYY43_02700 [Deltaproteobacteria bacterium]|nr:hypothetical protein [Deltaproteobacteria bacterium]MBI2341479.1 hypothetical protein [Deltaproteobacteria bacterium]MBI2974483.1 hypothetical protein [Deltaproteobacteria bacterium]